MHFHKILPVLALTNEINLSSGHDERFSELTTAKILPLRKKRHNSRIRREKY